MPTYVNPNACNACAEEHLGPLCVYICPNDLMVLDLDLERIGKARRHNGLFNRCG